MIIHFSLRSTGHPRSYTAPVTQTSMWPRVIQMAWVLTTLAGQEVRSRKYRISAPPGGWREKLPNHYYSEEVTPMAEVLSVFNSDIFESALIVGHHIDLIGKVLAAEYVRAEISAPKKMLKICTKKATRMYLGGEDPYGPNLEQTHRLFFGEGSADAQCNLIDARATAKCFFHLVKKGTLNLPQILESIKTPQKETA